MMKERIRWVAVFLVVAAPAAPVAAQCDERGAVVRSAELRAQLDDDGRKTRAWNIGWNIFYGATAVAQGAAGRWSSGARADDDIAARYYVGASKSAFVMLLRVLQPLRVEAIGAGDACADLEIAEGAFAGTAENQRFSYGANHVGTVVVNLAGLLYLGLVQGSWKQGVISFAIGYPIGLVSTYTQPRGSWLLRRGETERVPGAAAGTATWYLTAAHAPGYAGLGVAFTH